MYVLGRGRERRRETETHTETRRDTDRLCPTHCRILNRILGYVRLVIRAEVPLGSLSPLDSILKN